MSSVQSIERAFAVLDALGDGPLGVTGVAARTGLPKSTAARLLDALVAGERWSRCPAAPTTGSGSAWCPWLRRASLPLPRGPRPAAPGRARGRDRGGGRPVRPGGGGPLHRPGGQPAPGGHPRLDRHPTADAPRLVRAGLPGRACGPRSWSATWRRRWSASPTDGRGPGRRAGPVARARDGFAWTATSSPRGSRPSPPPWPTSPARWSRRSTSMARPTASRTRRTRPRRRRSRSGSSPRPQRSARASDGPGRAYLAPTVASDLPPVGYQPFMYRSPGSPSIGVIGLLRAGLMPRTDRIACEPRGATSETPHSWGAAPRSCASRRSDRRPGWMPAQLRGSRR